MGDPRFLLGLFFGASALVIWLAWPRHGLLAVLRRRVLLTGRVRAEDVLKLLFHRETLGPIRTTGQLAEATGQSPAGLEQSLALLVSLGLITRGPGGPELTERGRDHAVHLVRTHRLWERYLADRTGVGAHEWHDEAEVAEHRLSPEETRRLAERMGRPSFDPHGDPIPGADGVLPELEGRALTAVAPGRSALIVHLEDEPRRVYQHLLDAGLAPGQRLSVAAVDPDAITIVAGGRRSRLDREDAANVLVREEVGGPAEVEHPTLADVRPGDAARVLFISPACQGPQRRRLLDLGIVPDTVVHAELSSAMGDPVAYSIRGALIALRREQATWIVVERLQREAAA